MILESRCFEYEAIDIAEPGRQAERDRLKTCGAIKPALPPQLFNGDDYCGDYDQFDMANETDELDKFLGYPQPTRIISTSNGNGIGNGVEERISPEKDVEPIEELDAEGDKVVEETEERNEVEESSIEEKEKSPSPAKVSTPDVEADGDKVEEPSESKEEEVEEEAEEEDEADE